MPLKSLLAASFVALLALPAQQVDMAAAVRPSGEARPIVLLVHGRGHGGLDTTSLRRSWEGVLAAAAADIAGRSPFRDGDVSLVWYADALDPLSEMRCTDAPHDKTAAAVGTDDPFGALLGLSSVLLAALTTDMEGEGARELRNLAGDLQYFGDPAKRCAAEEQIGHALASAQRQGRPVILVAHSMGALVSWSYLHGRGSRAGAKPLVQRLVTLGSPIGSTEIRQLLLGGASHPLALPSSVGSWINIVDERDPFAVPLGDGVRGLADVLTRSASGEDPHGVERYLRDPATARAVLEAWCGAFAGASRPRECGSIAPR